MSVQAIETPSDRTPPSFGLWLSLLAIGLTLTVVRGAAGLFALINPETDPDTYLEACLGIGFGVFALVALRLLLRRRRRFIPVMIAFYVLNLLLGIVLIGSEVVYIAQGGVSGADFKVAVLVLCLQAVISALWLGYLIRSQHVREVCTQ